MPIDMCLQVPSWVARNPHGGSCNGDNSGDNMDHNQNEMRIGEGTKRSVVNISIDSEEEIAVKDELRVFTRNHVNLQI